MSNSNSNPNTNPNLPDSVSDSSHASHVFSPYGDPALQRYDDDDDYAAAMGPQAQGQLYGQALSLNQPSISDRLELDAPNGALRSSRPSTPALVYIVTSNFTSQTTADGVRLSESQIVGFQILSVFARLEDANAYAEHEFEEIDAGVRRRRRGRSRTRSGIVEDGEGVDVEVSIDEDGAACWIIESVGRIEVGQWTVQ